MVAPVAAYTKVVNNPLTDALFTADGVRNTLSDNGVQKTYRLAKQGDYKNAAKSATGDLLDISGFSSLFKKFNKTVGVLNKDIVAKLRHPHL